MRKLIDKSIDWPLKRPGLDTWLLSGEIHGQAQSGRQLNSIMRKLLIILAAHCALLASGLKKASSLKALQSQISSLQSQSASLAGRMAR